MLLTTISSYFSWKLRMKICSKPTSKSLKRCSKTIIRKPTTIWTMLIPLLSRDCKINKIRLRPRNSLKNSRMWTRTLICNMTMKPRKTSIEKINTNRNMVLKRVRTQYLRKREDELDFSIIYQREDWIRINNITILQTWNTFSLTRRSIISLRTKISSLFQTFSQK